MWRLFLPATGSSLKRCAWRRLKFSILIFTITMARNSTSLVTLPITQGRLATYTNGEIGLFSSRKCGPGLEAEASAPLQYRTSNILNSPRSSDLSTSTRSTRADLGPWGHQRINSSTCSASPPAAASTDPSGQFRTQPLSPKRRASSSVVARKKTPWTRPWIFKWARIFPIAIILHTVLQSGLEFRYTMRLLALDIGDKKIGRATTDELGVGVWPQETWVRKDLGSDLKEILGWIQDLKAETVVVGLPYNMDGTEGPQAKKVKAFVVSLQKAMEKEKIAIPVEWCYERL